MFCNTCGEKNQENSKFCRHCGVEVIDDPETIDKQKSPPSPYIISTAKLSLLSLCTFGLFEIYWFYRQWKSLKTERELKVTPWARTLFASLTSYSLFKEISKAVRSIDKTQNELSSGLLAISYFILISLYKLPDPYWWLAMFSFLPLIPAQKAINYYWENKYGEKAKKSVFAGWNIFWVVVGGILLFSIFAASLNTSSSTTNNEASINNSVSTSKPVVETVDNSKAAVNVLCDNKEGGSGTVFTKEGIVLTNEHVLTDSTYCLITIPDPSTGAPKEIYKSTPLIVPGLSKDYDIAMLSIDEVYVDKTGKKWGEYPTTFTSFTAPEGCQGTSPHLGDQVKIYGYPVTSGGYNLTITDGIISSFTDAGYILTSAKIDSGNSGGLAVDKNGCFIGIPSAVVSGDYQNFGVIIPVSIISEFFDLAQSDLDTPTPKPQNKSLTLPRTRTNTPIPSKPTIDCTGPDGKHLSITKEECDNFNGAWKPKPTISPSSGCDSCGLHSHCSYGYCDCDNGYTKNYSTGVCDPCPPNSTGSYGYCFCNSGYTKNYSTNLCEKNN